MKYTTIRISAEDKKKLEKLSRKLNKNLTETLRYAVAVAEKEIDKFGGNLNVVLSSLKEARDIGETNAEKVDA
ncbi:MAG TPA: hypothetical protein EYP30_10055, partial [Archaeoglobaceae archaeon]|nr:hypothetical protein [Archaeoglobaceae archaeon]